MAFQDIYEVVLGGFHTLGQTYRMVNYFRQTANGTPGGDSSTLHANFIAERLAYIRDVQSNQWTNRFLEVHNLTNPDDYDLTGIDATGNIAGDSLPAVLAIGFRSPRQAPGVHRGRHNLPLGVNTWLSSYGLISDAALESLYFLQQQLGLPITDTLTNAIWSPITVRKTYSDGVLVSVDERASLLGQWEVNRHPTTSKARQTYTWVVADEPV